MYFFHFDFLILNFKIKLKIANKSFSVLCTVCNKIPKMWFLEYWIVDKFTRPKHKASIQMQKICKKFWRDQRLSLLSILCNNILKHFSLLWNFMNDSLEIVLTSIHPRNISTSPVFEIMCTVLKVSRELFALATTELKQTKNVNPHALSLLKTWKF